MSQKRTKNLGSGLYNTERKWARNRRKIVLAFRAVLKAGLETPFILAKTCYHPLTLIRMTKDEKGLAFFKSLLL
jgi:hypothetical protein